MKRALIFRIFHQKSHCCKLKQSRFHQLKMKASPVYRKDI